MAYVNFKKEKIVEVVGTEIREVVGGRLEEKE